MKTNPRKRAVIVDAVRTPMGRSRGGSLRNRRAEELSGLLMTEILKRNSSIDPAEINDIIWGCVQQTLEQGYNVGRNAQLGTDIPFSVPAQTVNRLCGSSMTAIHMAVQGIWAEQGDIYLCGGVEHMGHVPMDYQVDFNPQTLTRRAKAGDSMGLTAEYLAVLHKVSREEQDQFAYQSHKRAHQATEAGKFKDEIVPVLGHDAEGVPFNYDYDEVIRAETNPEALAKLRPVFNPASGSVTAGNASAISDGASAVLVMSEERAKDLGLEPMAIVSECQAAGCDPSIMGYGPVPAVKKIYERTGLSSDQIDLFELNEAFAAQSLAVLSDLDLRDKFMDKVNVNGGAIALGHPLGCSGARITTTLLHEMKKTGATKGIATMCIGYGQGVATLFER